MSKIRQSFFLRANKIDLQAGYPWMVAIHQKDAARYGLRASDSLTLTWKDHQTEVAIDITDKLVKPGYVGLLNDITENYKIKHDELLEFRLAGRPISIKAIQNKLLGKKLSYKEISSIIRDIVDHKLDDVEIAFFDASSFPKNSFSRKELYYLTKAIAETGEQFRLDGYRLADKHSIGGLPGNRVTPIVVAIVASYDVYIPKTSSRAITSAAGTADTLEVIMPVKLSIAKTKSVVRKTHACLIWGGAVKLAPADDRLLKVSYRLALEPPFKMVVSIMAKKIAMGVKYLIIDMPIGKTAKVIHLKDAKKLSSLFKYIAKCFKIKIRVVIHKADGPVGRGIGPSLEARDILRVFQQKENRPLDLENKSIALAGILLELCGRAPKGKGRIMARQAIVNGNAWRKMQEIIKAQGGNEKIDSEKVKQGNYTFVYKSGKTGRVVDIDNKNLVEICRLLGAPAEKQAGVYLHKVVGNKIKKGEPLLTMHTISQLHINLARTVAKKINIFKIK